MSNFTPLHSNTPLANKVYAKPTPFLWIMILALIVFLVLYLLSEIYKKSKIGQVNPGIQKQAVIATSPTPIPATAELKTEYQNPLDEKTQYVNPFSEYKNPFDELK